MGKNWFESRVIKQKLDARKIRIARLRNLLKLPPLEDEPVAIEVQHLEWSINKAYNTYANFYNTYIYSANRANYTYNIYNTDRPEPEYEIENIPILAQRYAGLSLSKEDGKIRFESIIGGNGFFDVDSIAICKKAFMHAAPEWQCVCGFYAVPADKLPNYDRALCSKTGDSNQIILQVELSGKVIIHDEGYRAEYQKVLEVRIPDCHCGEPSRVIWFNEKTCSLERIDCGCHKAPQIALPGWVDDATNDISARSTDPTAAAYLKRALELAGIYEVAPVKSILAKDIERMLGIPFTKYES